MKDRFLRDVLLIGAIGAAALLPFLAQTRAVSSHEIRHAEIGREMAQSGNYLIPTLLGHPYRDKPPVLSAAIALLFRWHGAPSIALARLPCAVAGIAGAIVLYGLGRMLTERRAALLAALGVLGVQGYQDMARTARPDMLFTLAILTAALASIGALQPGRGRAGGFALAGAACAVASLLKGPLAWAFCALFPYLAWLRAPGLRCPCARDWLVFAIGFAAAAAIWALPVLIADRGLYLVSFLTQPDLTTWHLIDTFRRIHWPWMYGFVGLFPLALFLPVVAADARKRGVAAPLAMALAMLVVLSLIPKKRMHYQLPVYPFLALAVSEAVVRFAGRLWIERAARALVALSLAAGLLYYGALLPLLRPGEDPNLAAARTILAHTASTEPIIVVGQFAETIAFVGRRADVLERTTTEEIVDALHASPASALIIVARSDQAVLDPLRTRFPLDEVGRVEGERRTWLVYRALGAGSPGAEVRDEPRALR